MIAETAKQVYASEGVHKAIAFLEASDDPHAAMHAFDALITDAYWQYKDLSAVKLVGRAGIEWCLRQAEALSDDSQPDASWTAHKSAKILAYNLASFCWPGWDEPGIALTPDLLGVGFCAAQLNLQLTRQLDLGELALARGHWMLGAHHLTRLDYPRARALFADSARHAANVGNEVERLVAEGYAHLTATLDPAESDPTGHAQQLESVKQKLHPLKEGEEYVQQLDTVAKVCRRMAGR